MPLHVGGFAMMQSATKSSPNCAGLKSRCAGPLGMGQPSEWRAASDLSRSGSPSSGGRPASISFQSQRGGAVRVSLVAFQVFRAPVSRLFPAACISPVSCTNRVSSTAAANLPKIRPNQSLHPETSFPVKSTTASHESGLGIKLPVHVTPAATFLAKECY